MYIQNKLIPLWILYFIIQSFKLLNWVESNFSDSYSVHTIVVVVEVQLCKIYP